MKSQDREDSLFFRQKDNLKTTISIRIEKKKLRISTLHASGQMVPVYRSPQHLFLVIFRNKKNVFAEILITFDVFTETFSFSLVSREIIPLIFFVF